jgi:NTP pyrophosphatase (non-canonical NTP hydrolase)
MDMDEYQKLAARTGAVPDGTVLQLYDLGLGIAGEAGEVAEKLKKSIRDDGAQITDERKESLKKEIGDVLWYLSQLSRALGFLFSEVAQVNIDKLWERHQKGLIRGSGDNR